MLENSANRDLPRDYIPAPESSHALYRVALDTFEGPLDLLLFLIRRHRLDIFDIPVGFICQRYLDALEHLDELAIDTAAGFMVMAAELVHLKSKMLLPKPVEVEDEADDEDPRADLVRRLLEYERYRSAAEELASLERLGTDTWARAPEPQPLDPEGRPLREVSVFALVEAFGQVLKRQKPEIRHRVEVEHVAVLPRLELIIRSLAEQRTLHFSDLLPPGAMGSRMDVVVTLLALLEGVRLRVFRVLESLAGRLYIHAAFGDVDRALDALKTLEASYEG